MLAIVTEILVQKRTLEQLLVLALPHVLRWFWITDRVIYLIRFFKLINNYTDKDLKFSPTSCSTCYEQP